VVPSVVHEAQVTTLINLAARLTGKAARIRMGAIGAWPGQIPLLLWLLERDGLIQKELVERAKMEQSTVAEHLHRLERSGFVTRRRGAEDRRKFRFYLTEKARTRSRELIGMLESGARLFTSGIRKDELAVFDRVIRKIIAALQEYVENDGVNRRARTPLGAEKPRAKRGRRRKTRRAVDGKA
jgi:DNA-binding MarR family transcriptional regulator